MNILQSIRNHKVIVQNTGYLTAVEVMRMLLPFVALPYVIRTIGGERYGTIAFAQAVISYFVIFINFGMDVSAVKDVSVHRKDKARLNRVVSSVLLLKFFLFLLAFCILLIGIAFIPYLRSEWLLYLFVFMSCFSEILFPVWFYQGIEKMKYLTLIRFTSILFYTATVFLFVRSEDDYVNVALLQSLGYVVSGAISFYVLLKVEKVRLLLPSANDLKRCFVDSIPFFMSRISVVANNGMAKIVSGIFFNLNSATL
ncbi:oligosaccharide flippase family protein [Bacteroides fluxus]|uniref:oligosaccharide flippase family protein n=1 Tax=Bacteroides fluxus TaxID=626930 RepID=UPI002A812EE7|nr:oligosaccharide flippase family protein [Bacteroides fluxus]MDY3789210.1 oligosaccharide flippase family protein [Bacteroides fluxus]